LAIRHADSLRAPHSKHFEGFESYRQVKDSCVAALVGVVSRTHQVSGNQVLDLVGQRAVAPDAAVILSFGVLYALVALGVVRRVRREFPLDGGGDSVMAIVVVGVASALASGLAVLVGEWFSILIEIVRVGNGHLSNRTDRIPWVHHRMALFLAGVVIFWTIAGLGYRAETRRRVAPK
jgi:hypothetical protein